MNPGIRLASVAFLLALGCAAERAPDRTADRGSTPAAGSMVSAPADSLALQTPHGEVWFTAAREATDPSGASCRERVMEIRQDGRRTPIPLLYTGGVPRLVDDSTIEAAIWLHCRPGNVYRVNLRTGQPVRVQ